jgi:hypothetical protein
VPLWGGQAEVLPGLDPDADEGVPAPAGGAPDGGVPPEFGCAFGFEPGPAFEPLPMFGQLCVDPDPEFPVPEDDGVVDPDELDDVPELEFDVEPLPEFEVDTEPELPVEPVVAALATSAPPTTSPEVSAPTASTLRRRICIRSLSFIGAGPFGPVPIQCARDLGASAQHRQGAAGVS